MTIFIDFLHGKRRVANELPAWLPEYAPEEKPEPAAAPAPERGGVLRWISSFPLAGFDAPNPLGDFESSPLAMRDEAPQKLAAPPVHARRAAKTDRRGQPQYNKPAIPRGRRQVYTPHKSRQWHPRYA